MKSPAAIEADISPQANVSREILRDASFYSVCTYIYQLAAFAVGLVTKRFLGPEDAGMWSFFMMILSYLALQHMGIIDGSERQIAYYRGKGETDYARSVKDNMFGMVGLISIGVAVAMILVSVAIKGLLSEYLYWALLHSGLIIPVFLAVNYATVSLRATKRFKLLGTTMVAVSILNATAGIFLVWKWHLPGMFWAFFMINAVNVGVWFLLARKDDFLSFKFSFNKKVTTEVLKVGFPITLFGLVWTLLRTVDSLIVVSTFGTESLGFYALGVSVNVFIFHAPNALSIVMFPRFQERFGQSSDMQSLREYVFKPIAALAFFALPVLIGTAYFLIPPIIRVVLPEFVPGITPLKILLGGTFWISMVLTPFHFLVTVNKQSRAVILGLAGVVMIFAGTHIAIKMGAGLAGTALSVAASYMLFFTMVYFYVVKHFHSGINRVSYYSKIVFGFLWMATVGLFCDRVLPQGEGAISLFLWAGIRILVYLSLVIPLFIIAEKQTRVISELKKYIGAAILNKLKGSNRLGR